MVRKDRSQDAPYHARYYRAHRTALLAQNEVYRQAHLDKRRVWSRNENLRRYGLTTEDYDRMLAAQSGLCAICQWADEGRTLQVDHDHDTKRVRGLLCHQRNSALGLMVDDPETLRRAADYLEGLL